MVINFKDQVPVKLSLSFYMHMFCFGFGFRKFHWTTTLLSLGAPYIRNLNPLTSLNSGPWFIDRDGTLHEYFAFYLVCENKCKQRHNEFIYTKLDKILILLLVRQVERKNGWGSLLLTNPSRCYSPKRPNSPNLKILPKLLIQDWTFKISKE